MSLRVWTVAIAVAGLALYTLSLLPASGYESSPPIEPEPEPAPAQADVPGTAVFPLNYRDPAQIEFLPYENYWDDSMSGSDSLAPFTQPSIPLPERARPVASAPVQPIHSHISLEVLS